MRYTRKLFLLFLALILITLYITSHKITSLLYNPGLAITVANQGLLYDPTIFTPGTPSPSGNDTLAIVTGHLPSEDITWLYQHPLIQYPKYIYPINTNTSLLPNKGHEAIIYLKYILTHYPHFPTTVTLFIHPHHSAWHNNILLGLSTPNTIDHLSLPHIIRQGYFNLRCHLDPGCPSWLTIDQPFYRQDHHRKPEEPYLTSSLFRSLHNLPPSTPLPEHISQPCCAQFAVSTTRILSRPKSFYQHYYNWLLSTSLPDATSGRLFEYSWQFIFTNLFEFCPSQHACYCDGYGICFSGREKGLQGWLDILKKKEGVDEKIRRMADSGRVGTENYRNLVEQSKSINGILTGMRDGAVERGKDPKVRAEECGRVWREGDGF